MPTVMVATQPSINEILARIGRQHPIIDDDTHTPPPRPSVAYFLRYANGNSGDFPADPLDSDDRPARPYTDADMDDAPAGSRRAAYLAWLYRREQAESWIRDNTTVYGTPVADTDAYEKMQAAHAAYQADLAKQLGEAVQPGQVIISPATVDWWWLKYSLLQWQGTFYHPHPLTQVPYAVFEQIQYWYLLPPPYPPKEDEATSATMRRGLPVTPIPPLFASGRVEYIPSDKYVRGLVGAVRGVQPFIESEDGYPVTIVSEKDVDTRLSVGSLAANTHLTVEEKEMCWEVARKLGDHEADVMRLGIAIYEMVNPNERDPEGFVYLPIDDILDACGVVRVRDGHTSWHRTEDKNRTADAFRRLNMLRVEFIDRRDPRKSIQDTAAMVVDIRKTASGKTATHIVFKPGRWRAESARLIQTPQSVWMSQWVYKFDLLHEQSERRIGEYLTDSLRMNNGHPVKRGIGEILGAIGLLPKTSPPRPNEMREHFEKVLNRLLCPDVAEPEHAIIGRWHYADPAKLAALPKYKAFKKWTALDVIVYATAGTAQEHEGRAQRARAHAAQGQAKPKRGRPRKSRTGA